jgi:hypothetical protein
MKIALTDEYYKKGILCEYQQDVDRVDHTVNGFGCLTPLGMALSDKFLLTLKWTLLASAIPLIFMWLHRKELGTGVKQQYE